MRLFRWTDFTLPSTLQLKYFVSLLIEPVGSQKRESIELGLHEALVNAVIHGNSSDPDKSLRVRRIITPNWLVWQIQDEGFGLKEAKRVFCLPSDADAESGRGLFLIHECFDDVRWSPRGNRLQVATRRQKQLMRRTSGIFDFTSDPF
ncbi:MULTISPECIES: ATP-binding protein [Prochlorococcus]|uniref:Anti-sigma regulatory factor n=1 Tax=Prochlorococcus marinus (strain SARG / CCMP1375 / SS120) TaxID=167539 RepID=Q7VCG6_PROMA|nr:MULTISPECIES: ATP-binding protein [Prochlorococcus]AAP99818.1 Anti-sigma regulatory factor [Prochlorococcus marinus subsp. marinus str. CCMP1375]